MDEYLKSDPLAVYGKTLREYSGSGVINARSGRTCECSVRAVQLANGKILAQCMAAGFPPMLGDCYSGVDGVESVKGRTLDGSQFSLEEYVLMSGLNHTWQRDAKNEVMATLIAGTLRHSSPGDTGDSGKVKARFGLTNFDFFGNRHRDLPGGGGTWDVLALTLGERTIEVYEVKDHKAIIESVQAQGGVDVTCEAVIEVPGEESQATEQMDILCKLLSFASGTKINWVYFDCYDDSGSRMLSVHKNNVVWQYASMPLIDPRNPNDTASFVNHVYQSYLSQRDNYGLDIAIEAYLDSKRESGYLDTRALRAAVVLEYLRSKFAGWQSKEFVMGEGKFKDVRRVMRQTLLEQLRAKAISEDEFSQMEPRLGELNRPSFRTSLESLFSHLGLKMTQEELSRLIQIRNSLVHTASFLSKEPLSEYRFLVGVLDRVFLKIMNYEGPFLDITRNFERVNTSA